MRLVLLQGLLATLLISLHPASSRPQEDGYNYEVPENPLVISREPEVSSDLQADAQEGHSEGGHGHHGHSGDPLDWLRESIPGEPEVDYPILAVVPESSFSCDGKDDGMYADVEARCQVWHQCFGDRSWSFLCPNGTIFNQEIFTCVWWFDFDCSTAESFYSLNADLYSGPSAGGDTGGNGGDGGDVGISNLVPEIIDAKVPVEEAAEVISEPIILDPVVPAEIAPEIAPELAPELAPEPQPQPTPDTSVDEILVPLEPIDYNDGGSEYDVYDYAAEDEYDANDIPLDQRAPDSYIAAGPPESDYALPDYELPAEEVEEEILDEEEIIDLKDDTDLIEDEVSSEEQGYSYPVPENPLELPEKSSQSEALDLGLVDDAVAPLALYGAPAQPFELPPDTLPTAAPEEFEELPLAQYLPPATAPRQRRGQRFGRLGRRGRRRGGQRRKRLIRTVRLL